MGGVSRSGGRRASVPTTRTRRTATTMRTHRSQPIMGDRKQQRSAPHAGARTVRGSSRCSRLCLRNEQDLAGGLATLQGLVRFSRLGERELVLDPQLDLAAADPPEKLLGALEQLLTRGWGVGGGG